MASSRAYLFSVLDRLSDVPDLTFRPMMGEYLLYADGVCFGGVYDDRLLIKDTPAGRTLLASAQLELPYPGAKPMLLTEIGDRALLAALVQATVAALPKRKKR